MANSVPVTALAAEAVYGAINITITATTNPCLPYLQVASYQIWASTTNDRTAATQVGTSTVPFWAHTAATPGTTYWYWAKSVDGSGAVSDFYPTLTTSTATATAKTSAGLTLTLSASALVVPADASGNVTSFTGAATTAKVLDGVTDVTGSWSFSASATGVTVTQSTATFTLTAIAADNGFFDITATRAGYPNLVARCTVSESKTGATGAAGASAPALRLAATSQVFQITAAGANSPASIDFTASLLGGLSGTPTFSVTAGTATLTGSGLTRNLTYANLSTDTATIQATLSGSTDTITVAKIREGATGATGTAAVTALLSNEAHTLQADNAGVVGSFSGAATTITIYEGITDTSASWTVTKADTGVTSTLATRTVTITAAASDNGYVDITATRSGYTTIVKRFTITKSKQGTQGVAGTSAPALRLAATAQVFQVTAAGANSPASIDFTASLLGGLSGTPTFSVTSGTATLTGSGLTRNLTYANLSTDTATIQATLSGSTDYITVAKVREGATGSTGAAGADAVIALLSNEAHTLQADNAGVVGSFTGAVSTISIYVGATDSSASWTVTKADTNCTSTLATRTVTITAMSADSAYVDITATRSGWPTFVKRFTLTKSKAGATGTTGTTGTRGSMTFYVSGQSVWSDSVANTAAGAAPNGKQLNDVVTEYNATTFSQTKYWNGTAWTTITQAVDGNLLISGSVGATQISASYVYAGTLTATQITAGTFTGRTFRTASSGQRVEIDATNNDLRFYNSGGNWQLSMGSPANGGMIFGYVSSGDTVPAAFFTSSNASQSAVLAQSSNTASAIQGQVIGAGNTQAIRGTASAGSGAVVYGQTSSTASGVAGWFEISNTAGSHALRGINTATTGGIQGGSGIMGLTGSAGGYAVYSERGGYGPFTGQHDGVIAKAADVEAGDIVCDVRVIAKPTLNDSITEVERSSAPAQRTAVGVFANRRPMTDTNTPVGLADWVDMPDQSGSTSLRPRRAAKHQALVSGYDLVVINSVGEGLINVCNEGGNITAGDLIITSSKPGKGMKQSDDALRSSTVARARESVTFLSAADIQQIACIYLCG